MPDVSRPIDSLSAARLELALTVRRLAHAEAVTGLYRAMLRELADTSAKLLDAIPGPTVRQADLRLLDGYTTALRATGCLLHGQVAAAAEDALRCALLLRSVRRLNARAPRAVGRKRLKEAEARFDASMDAFRMAVGLDDRVPGVEAPSARLAALSEAAGSGVSASGGSAPDGHRVDSGPEAA